MTDPRAKKKTVAHFQETHSNLLALVGDPVTTGNNDDQKRFAIPCFPNADIFVGGAERDFGWIRWGGDEEDEDPPLE